MMMTMVMMMMAMIRRGDGCEAAWGRMARGEDERWERLASLDTSGDHHHRINIMVMINNRYCQMSGTHLIDVAGSPSCNLFDLDTQSSSHIADEDDQDDIGQSHCQYCSGLSWT